MTSYDVKTSDYLKNLSDYAFGSGDNWEKTFKKLEKEKINGQ